MFDLVIKNALLALPSGARRGDLAIANGKIAAIAVSIPVQGETAVCDASHCLLLPGGVDAQTQLELQSGRYQSCDGWAGGSRAALAGGTTTIIERTRRNGPENLSAALPSTASVLLSATRLHAMASCCDYGLHGPATPLVRDLTEAIVQQRPAGISSWSGALCGDFALDEEQLEALLRTARAAGVLSVIHCEDALLLQRSLLDLEARRELDACFFASSRPPLAEAGAVRRLLQTALQAGHAPVFIPNLSTAAALEEIRSARSRGQRNIFCGTCPQYLLLDELEYFQGEKRALFCAAAPPLRTASDAEALWEALASGEIDVVLSNHRAFSRQNKKQGRGDLRRVPIGVPGVEERLNLILSEGVLGRRLSLKRAVSALSGRPAALFGLSHCKGVLRKGLDADLVLYDPRPLHSFSDVNLHGEAQYSIYNTLTLRGRVRQVWLRGQSVYQDNVLSDTAKGQYIPRRCVFPAQSQASPPQTE